MNATPAATAAPADSGALADRGARAGSDAPADNAVPAPASRRREVAFWVALGGAVLIVALIAGPTSGGAPLDPRSSSGNGTRALVMLLRQLGATVDVTADAPGPGIDVVAVLRDELATARRDDISAWVERGGTLVVADPGSPLQPSAPVRVSSGLLATPNQVDGPCPEAGLDDVHRLSIAASLFLRLPPQAVGCFAGGGDAFFLNTQPVGQGRVTALGGGGVFTNTLLGHDDNSVLAADLFLVKPGAHVQIMLRSAIGGGHRSLHSLLGRPVRLALIQLLVAFGVVALWRGRRLGRPVAEVHPVELAGSELVVAVGNLLARTGRRDAAARMLRRDLHRSLAERLGLSPQAPPDQVADAAAARTGVDRHRLLSLLEDRPLGSDAQLVDLAQSIERTRLEVTHG